MKRIHHSLSQILVILLLSACGGGSSSDGGGVADPAPSPGPDEDTVACEITGPGQYTIGNSGLETKAVYTIENTGTVPITVEKISGSTSSSGTISVKPNHLNSGIFGTVLQAGDVASANVSWSATCTPPATAVVIVSADHSSSLGAYTCSLNVQFSCSD